MTNFLSSTESVWVHFLVSLFLFLPASFLFLVLKLKTQLTDKSRPLTPPHHRPPTSSPLSQPVGVSRDLDDFEPDDELTQVWLELLTDDPITFISTSNHLDRCYEAPDGQSTTNARRYP